MATEYDAAFFESHQQGAKRSARVIVPLVMKLVKPASVVDVGCGTGTWLSTFKEHGVEDLIGIDGAYVERGSLEISPDQFISVDLQEPFDLDRSFDLAVCLEVAEHLAPESAETFVGCLCKLAPVTLFSAAIPFQGGVNHVNEQWPDYWERHFESNGFIALDPIRPEVWQDENVEFWYAQNALLYVRDDYFSGSPALKKLRRLRAHRPLPIVHPTPFTKNASELASALEAYEYYATEARNQAENVKRQTAELDRLSADLEGLRTAAELLESERERSQAELADARDDAERYKEDAGALRADADRLRADAEAARADAKAARTDAEAARADADRRRTDAERYSTDLEDIRNEAARLASEATQARKEAETAATRLQTETWRLEDEIKAAREWAERRGRKIESLRRELGALQKTTDEITNELEHYKLAADPKNMSIIELMRALPSSLAGTRGRLKNKRSAEE